MRELVKSISTFTLGMSFLGLQVIEDIVTPDSRNDTKSARRSLEQVTNVAIDQSGPTLRSVFRAVDNAQRGMVGLTFDLLWPFDGRGSRRDERSDPLDGPQAADSPEGAERIRVSYEGEYSDGFEVPPRTATKTRPVTPVSTYSAPIGNYR